MQRQPPTGAPEGTIWFGGPIDRFKITLRVFGDFEPERISKLLGCAPTRVRRKGQTKTDQWFLEVRSEDCGEDDDVEDVIKALLDRLPSDGDLWASLTTAYQADLSCGIFLEASNRGFGISPAVSKMLADRHLEVGFDIYAPK